MKKLAVLGGGESGVGAAVLAIKQGYEVFLSDQGKLQEKYKNVLLNNKIKWEEGKHSEELILAAQILVKSPGIPDHAPLVVKAKSEGIQVISEIEFASWFTSAKLIGITGSNGKTTVTNMIFHILKNAGLDVSVGGNIGQSFALQVAVNPSKNYVLELSSFQLDGIAKFKPHIAIITSITPDHLDRYEMDFDKYIASKMRIAMNQDENDYLIYNADEESVLKALEKHPVKSQLIPMSIKKIEGENGLYLEDGKMIIKIKNNILDMNVSDLNVKGNHNAKNAMASNAVARLLKIRKETIRESMETFQGVEHRLEKVVKLNSISYINDSKATNINATYYALDSVKQSTIWIVGGVDKGNNYAELMELVNEKVKAIICLGVDNQKIIQAFNNVIDDIYETTSMEEAVVIASKLAEVNETVLLSPACASFDLFENYEDRGRQFKEAIMKL